MIFSHKKDAPPTTVTETARFGAGYETVNRVVGRRAVSPLASRINAVMMPVSIASFILTFIDSTSPVRIWLALAVFCFGPGSALVQYFRIPDPAMQLGMLLALSTALAILLAQVLLWIGHIDGTLAAGILAALTFVHPIARRISTSPEPSSSSALGPQSEGSTP